MAHSQEVKNRFIELRAAGKSYDAIAEETGVSKQTLIRWQYEHSEEIRSMLHGRIDSIITAHRLTRESLIENLCHELNRVKEEIGKRDLSQASLTVLISMQESIENRLSKQIDDTRATVSDILDMKMDFTETKTIENHVY